MAVGSLQCLTACLLQQPSSKDVHPSNFQMFVLQNRCQVQYSVLSTIDSYVQKHDIPTKKQDFLRHIGCKPNPKTLTDIDNFDRHTTALVKELSRQDKKFEAAGVPALQYQATAVYAEKFPANSWEKSDIICTKDTGQKARLRQRARGHMVTVTGGGHISYFDPLYKSEGPSQFFVFVRRLMILEFQKLPPDHGDDAIEKHVLCYDNMCHLNSLKAAKQDLPLPEPYKSMWTRINKIIDRLHIRNHKDKTCRDLYNPDNILSEGQNIMAAEQTFAWMSRFKKIVNSMNQPHHLFFLHRNIQRRNPTPHTATKKVLHRSYMGSTVS